MTDENTVVRGGFDADPGVVIAARWLLPMAPGLPSCIDDGAVWVRDGRIAAVGTLGDVLGQIHRDGFPVSRVPIDKAAGRVLMPGLINAHTHLFQSYLRGVHDDGTLETWLSAVIWPWVEHFTDEDYHQATALGAMENLRGGVTTVAEHAYMTGSEDTVEAVASAVAGSGLRAQIAFAFADQNYPRMLRESADSVVRKLDRLRAFCARYPDRLQAAVGPNTLWGVSRDLYRLAGEYATDHDLRLHAHVAETRLEVDYTLAHYGMRNVEVLDDLGLLTPRLQMVHCVWVQDDELERAARGGAHFVHCPISNMYLASGAPPAWSAVRHGVNVALATDGPASNNSQDMLETVKFAACLQKVTLQDPTVMDAERVLRMATLDAARALGLDAQVGSLEPGKLADMTRVDLGGLHVGPVHNPASALVYNANAADVRDVWVGGRQLLRDGEGVAHDFSAALERAQRRVSELAGEVTVWDANRLRAEGLQQ
ncbi:MAG: amidohydrolase [Gammaproteobacteria bacterium]